MKELLEHLHTGHDGQVVGLDPAKNLAARFSVGVVLPHGVHQDVASRKRGFPLCPSAMSLDPLVEVPALPLLVVLGDIGTG